MSLYYPRSSSAPRGVNTFVDENGEEIVPKLVKDLGATEWTSRYDGVSRLLDLTQSRTDDVAPHILKLFTPYNQCLADSNSKVWLVSIKP